MKFRVKDLKNYFKDKNLNWEKVSEVLTMKAFETVYNDGILDVDILPNRFSDAGSIIGICQEISALLEKKLNLPKIKIKENNKKITNYVKVLNKTKKATHYFGRVILNVKNSQSPQWLKEFVEFYGLNSVNLIVDLANFVMFEYGAPLHVFDLDKIKNKKIIVREAKPNEVFISLDEKEYKLKGGEILITDEEKILALAGIKGSKFAEVDLNTKNIFIEAAVFDSGTIYKTSKSLNLKTEASYRFERKVIPQRTLMALERISSLIYDLAGGEILKGKIFIGTIEKSKPITVDLERMKNFLGIEIKNEIILKYLKNLRIKIIKKEKEKIVILPPEDRIDLKNEEDIFEEILRFYGVDNVLQSFEPAYHESYLDENLELNYRIKNILKELGFSEVYYYNFINDKDLENFKDLLEEKKVVSALNPISENYKYFEFSLLPNLLKSFRSNQKNFKNLKLFRIEKIAFLENKNIKEKYSLCLGVSSKDKIQSLKEIKTAFNYLKNKLNIKDDEEFIELKNNFSSIAAKILVDNKKIGIIGVINNKIKELYDLDFEIAFLELDLEELKRLVDSFKEFIYWGDYPEIIRDLSFFVNKEINTKSVLKNLIKEKINNLKEIKILDIYFPENYDNKKSITLRFVFQNQKRTLKEEEVDQEIEKIVNILTKNFKAQIR